jgi:hypothetical protein
MEKVIRTRTAGTKTMVNMIENLKERTRTDVSIDITIASWHKQPEYTLYLAQPPTFYTSQSWRELQEAYFNLMREV